MPTMKKMVAGTPMRRGGSPPQRQDLSGVRDDGTLVGRGGNTQQLGAAAKRRLAREQPQPSVAASEPAELRSGRNSPVPLRASPGGLRGFAPAGVTTATATREPTTASVTTEPSDIQARMVQLAEERGLVPPAGAGGGGPAAGISPGSGLAGRVATALEGAAGAGVPTRGNLPGPTDTGVAKRIPGSGGITDFMARGATPPGDPGTPYRAIGGLENNPSVALDPRINAGGPTGLRGFAPAVDIGPTDAQRAQFAGLPQGGSDPASRGFMAGAPADQSPFEGLATAALQRRRSLGGGGGPGAEMRAY